MLSYECWLSPCADWSTHESTRNSPAIIVHHKSTRSDAAISSSRRLFAAGGGLASRRARSSWAVWVVMCWIHRTPWFSGAGSETEHQQPTRQSPDISSRGETRPYDDPSLQQHESASLRALWVKSNSWNTCVTYIESSDDKVRWNMDLGDSTPYGGVKRSKKNASPKTTPTSNQDICVNLTLSLLMYDIIRDKRPEFLRD